MRTCSIFAVMFLGRCSKWLVGNRMIDQTDATRSCIKWIANAELAWSTINLLCCMYPTYLTYDSFPVLTLFYIGKKKNLPWRRPRIVCERKFRVREVRYSISWFCLWCISKYCMLLITCSSLFIDHLFSCSFVLLNVYGLLNFVFMGTVQILWNLS